ncbi:E3 ubiquitin-protein ligase TRIM39-like [Hyperolius riggenbachi]|uniref:E3 ubiquitin-protein ligase TRIM39-like n=1 Tax=Hyperolius riggenbachi TaxID=752182 RepID=UPI0035A3196D
MASAHAREQLECSVCLKLCTDPVTLRCGHSFCQACTNPTLDSHDRSGGLSCPRCREKFRTFRKFWNSLSSQPDKEKRRVHNISGSVTLLESRDSSIQKEPWKYFGTKDSASTGLSNNKVREEHQGHQIHTLDEATKKKKRRLRDNLQKLVAQKENKERVQSLQECRRKAQEKAVGEAKRVTASIRDFQNQLEDLEKRVLSDINRQMEHVLLSYDDKIKQLERQKSELHNVTAPLTVLQEPDMGDLCDLEDGDNEDRERQDKHDGEDLDVAIISQTFYKGLSHLIAGINGGISVQRPAKILLDENTAGNPLHISDDRKTASWSNRDENHPATPERFQYEPQVLSLHSFSSGRHYWEVDVGGSGRWRVGMCYPSINRKRWPHSRIGYNNESWCLEKWDNQYSVVHGSKKVQLSDKVSSNRVRISLDYEAGQISFYDLSIPVRHLHTFTATFTETLHAALWVWDIGGCIAISGDTWDA